jgi:hypothetical protein
MLHSDVIAVARVTDVYRLQQWPPRTRRDRGPAMVVIAPNMIA